MPDVWSSACGVSKVSIVPHLFPQFGVGWNDPWGEEGKLVEVGGFIMATDPVSDLATRIRNGLQIEATHVDVPTSILKVQVAAALQREGFIWDFEQQTSEGAPGGTLRINLKYGPSGERVVRSIRRISKPGRRVYFGCENMPKVLGGMGVLVLSTNQGVLSNREAKEKGIGGEALLEIW